MAETTGGSNSGVARAVTELTDETAGLVRRELDSAKRELLTKAAANLPALALLGLAALLSVLSVASTHRWILRLLEKQLPPATASLIAAVSFGGSAGAAAVVGAEWLRKAPTPLPTDTARDATETAAEVRTQVRESRG